MKDKVRALLHAPEEYPSLSILMPTHRGMPDKLQDPIRLKNFASKALDALAPTVSKAEFKSFSDRLHTLISEHDLTETLDGLALFINKTDAVILNLPFAVKEKVILGTAFAVTDILQEHDLNYWVVLVSEKVSRLFSASNHVLHEIVTPEYDGEGNPIQGFPLDMLPPANDASIHAVGSGDKDALYRDSQLKKFFRLIDKELGKILQDLQQPVVVCGTQHNVDIFKEVTAHAYLLIPVTCGDFNKLAASGLAKEVWPKVREHQEKETEKILQKYFDAANYLKQASGIRRVFQMIREGRVDTLLVEKGLMIPGRVDDVDHYIIPEFEFNDTICTTDNLVDIAVERVSKIKGKIVIVGKDDLKDHEGIGAILRY